MHLHVCAAVLAVDLFGRGTTLQPGPIFAWQEAVNIF